MNRLTTERRAQIIGALVEGNSIRATVRMTAAAKNTVTKLLVDLGAACADYQDQVFRELACQTIQCDEIWAFCYAKQKNVPEQHKGTFGYATCGRGPRLMPTRSSFLLGSSENAPSRMRLRS